MGSRPALCDRSYPRDAVTPSEKGTTFDGAGKRGNGSNHLFPFALNCVITKTYNKKVLQIEESLLLFAFGAVSEIFPEKSLAMTRLDSNPHQRHYNAACQGMIGLAKKPD